MTTNRRPLWMALVVRALFSTTACNETIKHTGIFAIVDNVLFGRDPMEGVDPEEDLGLSCGASCAVDCVNCEDCQDCAACDCSDCSSCANCSDCSGCEDCGCTIEPHVFNVANRIPNSAQVRLTSHGLEFLSASLNDLAVGVLPPLDVQTILGDVDLGEEITEFSIGNNGTTPDFLLELRNVEITSIAANGDLSVNLSVWGATTANGTTPGTIPLHIGIATSGSEFATRYQVTGSIDCELDLNASDGLPQYQDGFEFTATVRLAQETVGPRAGYGRLQVSDIEFVEASLEGADINIDCSDSAINVRVENFVVVTWVETCNQTVGVDVFLNDEDPAVSVCGLVQTQLDDANHGGGSSPHLGGVGQLVSEITDQVRNSIEQVLDYRLGSFLVDTSGNNQDGNGPWIMCEAPGPGNTCPAGTTFAAANASAPARCMINGQSKCLAPLLGIEGRVDMGSALASISPGLDSVIDFVFAAAGPSRAPNDGWNIDLFGGLENLAHNDCVPVTPPGEIPTPPQDVPLAEVLQNNTHPGTGGPTDLAIGVSESFVNYAAWRIWDSGLLCLNVGTNLDQMLSGSTLNALFFGAGNSLAKLTFPDTPASAAFGIALRPATAPVVSFGDGDPETDLRLINVAMDALELDFYAWTQDRYIRFFTLKTDLEIGLDLPVEDNTITINASEHLDLIMNNPEILNSDLIVANASSVGATISSLAGTIVAGLGAAIPPISLDEMLGGLALPGGMALPLGIAMDENSFTPFEQTKLDGVTTERFLGIFIDFTDAPPAMALTARADAAVRVTNVTLPEDRTGFAYDTFQQGPSPSVEIAMSATAPEGAEVEYAYRLTNSSWSEWTTSPYAVIEDPSLFMQQWHTVYVRARIKGAPYSTDFTSATARFLIDADAPQMTITSAEGAIELGVYDIVDDPTDLEYRYRNPGEEWSAWAEVPSQYFELDGATPDVEVELRDTSGNVASNTAALRGIPDPDAASGCGSCSTTGFGDPSTFGLAAMVLGTLLSRRRRKH